MAGSIYGTIFKISTWGESHGAAVGVVIDGCPAGLPLTEADIQEYLNRRKPGQSKFTTPRREADLAEILSGTFEGYTTGTPISIMVRNENQFSKDYDNLKDCYRPGHADYTLEQKYGIRDYRGGGRSSGRETIGRVAAGAVACKLLNTFGIHLLTYTKSIGDITISDDEYDYHCIPENPLYMPHNGYAEQASSYLKSCMQRQDSVGGVIECVVTGMPVGIGDTVFEKLDANLAKALMSVGSVKGVEIGDGFAAAQSLGSYNNDTFRADSSGISKNTNHSGGVLGGMSDGSNLILRAAIKPTPSISQLQHSANSQNENVELAIHGRHDPVIVPRAVVVVESMTAITLIDMMLTNMSAKLDKIIDFYK